jgi:hypothetical protein
MSDPCRGPRDSTDWIRLAKIQFDAPLRTRDMSEIFDSTAQKPAGESSGKTISACGTTLKEKLLTQAKQEPAIAFLIVLAGSMMTGLLLGYFIFHNQAESRRQRLMEDWMDEVTNWIREHSRDIAAPVKGRLEAARTAVEEVTRRGAQARGRLQAALKKEKRSFLNLF